MEDTANSNLTLIMNNTNSNVSTASTEDNENLYDVPTWVVVILSLFYGLISLTAFIGNSLVSRFRYR